MFGYPWWRGNQLSIFLYKESILIIRTTLEGMYGSDRIKLQSDGEVDVEHTLFQIIKLNHVDVSKTLNGN